ncbi:MAG: hypothetical protein J2O38_05265, partial [Acidimicrobiales bacterium]|nr:hypothetical protein [Acidimicrobiales bacterium]
MDHRAEPTQAVPVEGLAQKGWLPWAGSKGWLTSPRAAGAAELEEATVRLSDKVALVMGGGQTKGQTIGNGRATAVLFAREGARVAVVDRDKDAADETVELIANEG